MEARQSRMSHQMNSVLRMRSYYLPTPAKSRHFHGAADAGSTGIDTSVVRYGIGTRTDESIVSIFKCSLVFGVRGTFLTDVSLQ